MTNVVPLIYIKKSFSCLLEIFFAQYWWFLCILLKYRIHLMILWELTSDSAMVMMEDYKLWWGPHCKQMQHGHHVNFEGGHLFYYLSWDFGGWPMLILGAVLLSKVTQKEGERFSNLKYWGEHSDPECYNGHQWDNNYWCTTCLIEPVWNPPGPVTP